MNTLKYTHTKKNWAGNFWRENSKTQRGSKTIDPLWTPPAACAPVAAPSDSRRKGTIATVGTFKCTSAAVSIDWATHATHKDKTKTTKVTMPTRKTSGLAHIYFFVSFCCCFFSKAGERKTCKQRGHCLDLESHSSRHCR